MPQDFPLNVVDILTSISTAAYHDSANTSAGYKWIRIRPADSHFIQCITNWDTSLVLTPGSPLQCCQYSYRKYDQGSTLSNGL